MTITRSNQITADLFSENLYLGISCILDTCLLNDVILSLCALGCEVTEDFKYWNKV